MEIKVERIRSLDGGIVFTIHVNKPHLTCFGDVENKIMKVLDKTKLEVESSTNDENVVKQDVINLIHLAKEKTFVKIIKDLKSSIKNDFEPFFTRICQEMYNWIYDYQESPVRDWLHEFDPQRTTFYFDNDKKTQEMISSSDEDDDESQLGTEW